MNNIKLSISDFQKHIFWNYKPDAVLDENVVIENVILYGELSDFSKLIRLVSRDSIRNVNDKIDRTGRYRKRVNFVRRVLL
jgi:hypothetical protein